MLEMRHWTETSPSRSAVRILHDLATTCKMKFLRQNVTLEIFMALSSGVKSAVRHRESITIPMSTVRGVEGHRPDGNPADTAPPIMAHAHAISQMSFAHIAHREDVQLSLKDRRPRFWADVRQHNTPRPAVPDRASPTHRSQIAA